MNHSIYRRRRKRMARSWKPRRRPLWGAVGVAVIGIGAWMLGLSLNEIAHVALSSVLAPGDLQAFLVIAGAIVGLMALSHFIDLLRVEPKCPLVSRVACAVAVATLTIQVGIELHWLLKPHSAKLPHLIESRAVGLSFLPGTILVGLGVLVIRHLYPQCRALDPAHLRADPARPRRVLIVFAPPDRRLQRPVKSQWYVSRIHPDDPTPATELYDKETDIYLEPITRLQRMIERCPKDEPWAGERLLRAIKPHLTDLNDEEQRLECIYLIGSQGAHGSFRELPNLFDFLRAALPMSVDIYIGSKAVRETTAFSTEMAIESSFFPECAVDTSRPEQCIEFVNDLMGRIREKGYNESDIALDISDMLSPRLGRTIGDWMRGGLTLQSAPRWVAADQRGPEPSAYSLSDS